ncbi:MAG: insulinase family protein [Deltaproteobacteria bacterium]|nr:insulinase family protein [Deltaproteobacteria bacterium]
MTAQPSLSEGGSTSPVIVRARRVEGAPVVAVRVGVAGGARLEEIPGQALISGRLLSEGTHKRDWRRLAEDAEDRGMIFSSSGSFEGLGVSVDALAVDWKRGLHWAAEAVLESTFPADRCSWLCRQAAAELESLADQPEMRCVSRFLEQLYSPHPLARRIQGDATSLARLSSQDCRSFHQRSVNSGLAVVVTGPVDEEEMVREAERAFAGLVTGQARLPEQPERPSRGTSSRCRVEVPAGEQAHLLLGHLTVDRSHPDVAALEVLAVILGAGSGLGGRIPARIREKEGLAYSAQVHTFSGAGLDPGRFVVYLGTSPTTLKQAERGVREEIDKLLDKGVSDQEVEEARSYLLGREPFRRETARQWADLLLEAQFYGLPLDDLDWRIGRLLAVDVAAVNRAARQHLDPNRYQITEGMPKQSSAGRSAAASSE